VAPLPVQKRQTYPISCSRQLVGEGRGV